MSHSHNLETPRMVIGKVAPQYYKAMSALEGVPLGIEHSLHELIKLRGSQLNGCGFCIDMHTKDALAQGETVQRIVLLDAWRESPMYTDRERAALALTEAITNIQDGHVPDDVYNEAAEQFEEPELAEVIFRIGIINMWNRIAISTRSTPGSYQRRETPVSTASAAG